MAANLQNRGLTTICRRFNLIRACNFQDPAPVCLPAISDFRNWLHSNAYDKNPDDHAIHSTVPDDVLEPKSGNYWALHPETGVFAPTDGSHVSTGRRRSYTGSSPSQPEPTPSTGSVLDQQVWFRPLEDIEKQPPSTD